MVSPLRKPDNWRGLMGEGDIKVVDGGCGGILRDLIASCEEMSAIEEKTAK